MTIKPVEANATSGDSISNEAYFESVDDAIGNLSAEFSVWARDGLAGLLAALEAPQDDPATGLATARELYTTMHDLKGQAGTFGFDLLGKIGASACDYCRNLTISPTVEQGEVLRFHVMSAQFLVERNLKGDDDSIWDRFRDKRDAMIARAGIPGGVLQNVPPTETLSKKSAQ